MFNRCKRCGTRTLSLKKENVLCRDCHGVVEEDVAFRKTEIRKALAELRNRPAHAPALLADAKSHLDVLLAYERKGIARIRPEPVTILHRLKTLGGEPLDAPPARKAPAVHVPAWATGANDYYGDGQPSVIFAGNGQEQAFGQGDGAFGASDFWIGNDAAETSPAAGMETPDVAARPERRAAVRTPVNFKLVIDPLGAEATARDLSPGGIYLETASLQSYRKPLWLRLSTPGGELETMGVVRRTDRRRDPELGELRDGLAIQFTSAIEDLPALGCQSGVVTLLSGASATA